MQSVCFHLDPFIFSQFIRFFEDSRRNVDFAHVMQRGLDANGRHKIEALGLVLVVSLLLWRLMERTMRKKTKEENSTLTGWNNGKTTKPTSFMMVSKFISVVAKKNGERSLFTPLNKVQLAYLNALEVRPAVFTEIDLMPGAIRSG